MARKIRRYRNGYLIRKRRRAKVMKVLFTIFLLALLVFLGYSIAKSLSQIGSKEESSSEEISISSEIEVAESSEESSSQIEENSFVRSILLPTDSMTLQKAEEFIKSVDTSLYNSITVELKNKQGLLLYPSEIALAKKSEAIAETTVDHKALAELISKYNFTPIARIYALEDDYASHATYNTSYTYDNQSDITWLDNSLDAGGKSWLNPYKQETIDYLTAVTEEVLQAGYKALIVNSIQYPNTANQTGMTLGDTNELTKKQALEKVLESIVTVATKYSAKVIPAYKGICYLGESAHIYTVNPNEFNSFPSSPIIEHNVDLLQYVIASANDIIPTVSSKEEIPLLEENGIKQYIVG